MKSNVASNSICRARSLRNRHAPLSTPTRVTDCPAKSRVISWPMRATLSAICVREMRTFMFVGIAEEGLYQKATSSWLQAASQIVPRILQRNFEFQLRDSEIRDSWRFALRSKSKSKPRTQGNTNDIELDLASRQ